MKQVFLLGLTATVSFAVAQAPIQMGANSSAEAIRTTVFRAIPAWSGFSGRSAPSERTVATKIGGDGSVFRLSNVPAGSGQGLEVAKYSKDGKPLWVRAVNVSGAGRGAGLSLDPQGSPILVGTSTLKDRTNMLVAKLDRMTGNPVFASSFAGPAEGKGYAADAVGCLPDGSIVVSGGVSDRNGEHPFVARLRPDGSDFIWKAAFSDAGYFSRLIVAGDRVYVGGNLPGAGGIALGWLRAESGIGAGVVGRDYRIDRYASGGSPLSRERMSGLTLAGTTLVACGVSASEGGPGGFLAFAGEREGKPIGGAYTSANGDGVVFTAVASDSIGQLGFQYGSEGKTGVVTGSIAPNGYLQFAFDLPRIGEGAGLGIGSIGNGRFIALHQSGNRLESNLVDFGTLGSEKAAVGTAIPAASTESILVRPGSVLDVQGTFASVGAASERGASVFGLTLAQEVLEAKPANRKMVSKGRSLRRNGASQNSPTTIYVGPARGYVFDSVTEPMSPLGVNLTPAEPLSVGF